MDIGHFLGRNRCDVRQGNRLSTGGEPLLRCCELLLQLSWGQKESWFRKQCGPFHRCNGLNELYSKFYRSLVFSLPAYSFPARFHDGTGESRFYTHSFFVRFVIVLGVSVSRNYNVINFVITIRFDPICKHQACYLWLG